MKREDILAIVATVVADELGDLETRLEARVDRLVAAKPLPPFGSPAGWVAGRHSAGVSVRHRNGLFTARRDTETEPGCDESWLPLVVGVAGFDMHWIDERTFAAQARLSDGAIVQTTHNLPVPIVRGYWRADVQYREGDRVFRFAEYHALRDSYGVDPNEPGGESDWLKVGGKPPRAATFKIDDEGTVFESGHPIGSLKPLIVGVLNDLLKRKAA